MSGCKDIRSYFTVGASKIKDLKDPPKVKKKRAVAIISDSDSDEPSSSPAKRHKSSNKSGSQETNKKNFQPLESKPTKKINPIDVFGTAKVKREVAKSASKLDHEKVSGKAGKVFHPKKQMESESISIKDENAEKHSEITEKRRKYFEKEGSPKKSKNNLTNESRDSPGYKSKVKENVKKCQDSDKSSEVVSTERHPNEGVPEKRGEKRKATDACCASVKKPSVDHDTVAGKQTLKLEEHASGSSIKPSSKHNNKCVETTENANSSNHNRDLENTREDVTPFGEAACPSVEKPKQNAYNYQRYLQREGPRHRGAKVLPKGKLDCLAKMVFVVTGVLDSLEREEAVALIQEHGGKVTSNVSRNTTYVVVGEEAGPSKLAKAKTFNTPQIDEDGLLDLIREKSGIPEGEAAIPVVEKTDDAKVYGMTATTPVETKSHKALCLVESRIDVAEEECAGGKRCTSCDCHGVVGSVEAPSLHTESLLWVDKYRPTNTKNIIGQQGDRSNLRKLQRWLANWHSNHSGQKKLVRPSPWSKDDSGSFFKAALLSGAPGVGKTTTAHLVCKELGFDVVEFNASDTRSKRLLHDEVQDLLKNKSLFGYFKNGEKAKPTEKHVLLMEEVDGMAGNEDRGGVQELIQHIKDSRVPIICTCNDRHYPKIRSLVNYCFDLTFSKPRVEQIKGAMMSICYKEGVKITPEALTDIITASNQDIRQVLHHLSVFSAKSKNMSTEQTKKDANEGRKLLKLGPWDVVRKVFSASEHKNTSLMDRTDLFFQDYNIGPLFVQQNYLSAVPHAAKGNLVRTLECVANTAESLTLGDVVEKSIRSSNNWSLLPVQAIYSSVVPGDCMEGHLSGQINFPAWLGKNSRAQKLSRLQQELQCHMRLSITGDKHAVGLEYVQFLGEAIVSPLAERGVDGMDETIQVLQSYHLTREDLDIIVELAAWPGKPDPMSRVDSKVKAAFTRKYNKEAAMLPFALDSVKKVAAKAVTVNAEEEMDLEDGTEDIQENDDDVATDSMIKTRKKPSSNQKESKDKAVGSSSAKKTRSKGRAR